MAVADALSYDLDPVMSPDLATLVSGMAAMFAEAEFWSLDRDDLPGWGLLFAADDPAQTFAGLRWMAQLVGEAIPQQVTLAAARAQIHDQPHKRRGTLASIIAAARATLTGAQTVILRERDATVAPTAPAYGLTVITYTAQTPNAAVTEAAIRSVLPAGIVLNYESLSAQDYQHVRDTEATYTALRSAFATYDLVRTGV